MSNKQATKRYLPLLWLCLMGLFVSCGTVRNGGTASLRKKASITAEEKDPLTPEQRRKYDYYFLEGVRLKEKGEYDAAFEMYSHCLDIYPKGAATLYEIAKFYMFLNQPDKGEEALKEAVKSDPQNFWYNQTLAAYYQNKGEFPKAIYVYEDMSNQFPTRLEPLMALVDLYTRTKDYRQVVNTLNRLEAMDGKSEQISMEKFRMYLTMGNDEQAFTEIENLAKEYPYDMRYLTILGDVYLNNGKEKEAYDTYQKVLKEEPDYAPAMLSMASYYEKKGEESLYRAQLDSILLNDEVASDTKMNIMRQLILRSEQGDRDSTKIVGLFTSMLERKQENADIAMLAAQYLLTKKMDKESVPVLRQVLELDPENIPARLQLLNFAIREQDMDKVIEICAPALEYTPETLEFYYYIGLAYHQKNEPDEALEVFKKGVNQVNEKSDKNMVSDFYAIMGDLYHIKKMNVEAYAAYDSALVYKEDNIGALNNYAYYLSVERKHLDKAEEMSYRTVKAEPTNGTYLDTYAWILFEKGKYAEAKIYIDQAMQNGGDQSSVVIEHCGDIYYMSGDKEKALEYWKQAEELSTQPPQEGDTPREEKELKLLKKKIAQKKYFAE
ncbi:tetratricopeptide repeat protein [Phocaeicola sp.]